MVAGYALATAANLYDFTQIYTNSRAKQKPGNSMFPGLFLVEMRGIEPLTS